MARYMCFCPVFESKIVDTGNRASEACIVKTYVMPTEKVWFKLCVGTMGKQQSL